MELNNNDIIIISAIAGLISSLLALFINILLSRPRLALSTEIVCGKSTKKEGEKRYLIKMMNKSWAFRIYNISIYEFYHLKNDKYYVTQIRPIPCLEKWKRKQERRGLIAILNGPKRDDEKRLENHTIGEWLKEDLSNNDNKKSKNQDIEKFLTENPSNYVEVVIICSSRFGGVKNVFRQKYHFAALRKGYGFVATSVETYRLEQS